MKHPKLLLYIVSFLCIFSLCVPVAQGVTRARGPSLAVQSENQPHFVEQYRIQIVNDVEGLISIAVNGGKTWKEIGKVLAPTYRVGEQGYTASKWVGPGEVAATAVNAIHINAGYNKKGKEEKGIVFSILPKEQKSPPAYYNSYANQDASIYTDIPSGELIFGGGWASFVGNPVFFQREGAKFQRITEGYVPQIKDVITIVVLRPDPYPEEIVFENRFGGWITIQYPGEEPRVIGEVLKPVFGVGRFQGTQYAAAGRIRANHAGVIDISTSLLGKTSGIQIIPANHGMSPEMSNARYLTQWMVIGPPSVQDPSYEGVAPLFRYFLQPAYDEKDLREPDWVEKVSKHFLVQVRMKEGPWQPGPIFELDPDTRKPLASWAGTALKDMTHLKILLPIWEKTWSKN